MSEKRNPNAELRQAAATFESLPPWVKRLVPHTEKRGPVPVVHRVVLRRSIKWSNSLARWSSNHVLFVSNDLGQMPEFQMTVTEEAFEKMGSPEEIAIQFEAPR